MVYEVKLTQTFELVTKVEVEDGADPKVAVELARMEMRTGGMVVDEHHDVRVDETAELPASFEELEAVHG